ncbi:MAG TPA: alpha/beta hydrolase [Thermoanaerobaculia bacterium]|nr:alpha/beta hydrolase [Thermoanaerobaculia bacterium]
MKIRPIVLAILASAGFGVAAPALAAEAPRGLELAPCKKEGLPPDARCGTYEVFENRAARTGRKIPLQVVVLPAKDTQRLPDPYVYFAGGPGDSSIEEGLFFAQQLASLRQKRDVLLVDVRGTGASGGLFCPELQGRQGVQGFLDNFLPTDKVRACRDRLKKEVDLSWYTSDAAMDDVEEVRTALGYGKANLMGGSYGTRAALTYLRRHPQSVRTITLLGVVPPDDRYPLGVARSAQNALDGLIAECEGDAACHGAFPQLRQELDAVLRRVTAETVRVELLDPATGEPFELRMGRAAVAQTLRYMTYSPSGAALLPLLVHQAAAGDFAPLAQTARLYGTFMTSTADGFYQSVTCAEDVAFIRDEEVAAAVAGTTLGDFRIRQQKAACEGWPTRDLGKEIQTPVVSDVPALLVSGERDPVTPPANGEKVVRTLKNGRHLIVADAGHSTEGMQGNDCLFGVMAAFIEAGTVQGLDTSCVTRMRRPDFELRLGDPAVTLTPANLERLAGTYENAELGLTVRVDVVRNRLRVELQGNKALLVATSPTRFRIEGFSVSRAAVFQEREGRIIGLVLTESGSPDLVMTRTARD